MNVPIKAPYTLTQTPRYPFHPITRNRGFSLPGDARVAFVIYVNIEHFPLDVPQPAHAVYPGTQHMVPDILNYGWRDYGNRVGIWRLFELLDSYGLRASVNLHADVCHEYPEVIAAGSARNWEWNAQGHTASSTLNGMSDSDAQAVIRSSLAVIAEATGKQPKGWLGSHLAETFATPDLLAEAGIKFVSDYACDDQPFAMKANNALPFVPAITQCKVIERRSDLQFVREISLRGEVMQELVTLEPERRVTFERLTGTVLGTILNEIEEEHSGKLNLRFSYNLTLEGVAAGSKEEKEYAQTMEADYLKAVDATLEAMRRAESEDAALLA